MQREPDARSHRHEHELQPAVAHVGEQVGQPRAGEGAHPEQPEVEHRRLHARLHHGERAQEHPHAADQLGQHAGAGPAHRIGRPWA